MNQPAPPIGHNQPPPDRDAKIMEWNIAKEQLANWKDKEAKLRKEVIHVAFPAGKSGTNKLELGMGYELKAVIKYNYKIEKGADGTYNYIMPLLAQLPKQVADSLIKWTPELSQTAYKQLTKEEQAIVNQFVVITEGSSSLELKVPPPNAG